MVPPFLFEYFIDYTYIMNLRFFSNEEDCIFFSVMETFIKDQAGCLENTPLLPQRGKTGSVSGFALLSHRSRNHARSAFKRFSRHPA
jgi:hypothetical protein